jgi:hypothetical protein
LVIGGIYAYRWYKSRQESANEQFIGKAASNAKPITLLNEAGQKTTLAVPSAEESKLEPGTLLLRSTDKSGALTTYKVRPNDLSMFQRWYVGLGLFDVKKDILKPNLW